MSIVLSIQRPTITKAFTTNSRRFVATASRFSSAFIATHHHNSNPAPPTAVLTTQYRHRHRHLSSLPMAEIDTMADIETAPITYPIEMTEDERYLFDLNGYIIIRNVLSPSEVAEANSMIDNHQTAMIERKEASLRNAVKGTAFYGSGPGRKDLGAVLEWGDDSKVFKSILAHPRLVPLFHGIMGKGYRLDHLPFVIAQDKGAEGFQLHGGTVDCTSGDYNPHLAYTCHNGFIRSALMGCNVMLTDHDAGFGGFCVVPGSHKSNFKMPPGMVDGEKYKEFIQQPATKAGDVVLFSEGTVHGAMAWTQEFQRRVCLYRFSPATNVYGRSYFTENGKWPAKMYEGMNDAERAVLEPPYANRLDRPEIMEDAKSVQISTRNDRKKQHDQELFGTKYF
jgi:ectoine hydroxylase-related dioxygenase (phytanoyl-CoA dioxygenase family)